MGRSNHAVGSRTITRGNTHKKKELSIHIIERMIESVQRIYQKKSI